MAALGAFMRERSVSSSRKILRRDFLKGAGAVSLAAGASIPALAQSAATRPADVVLRNGKIITVDAGNTVAQAIAISGDRIVAVGPDAAMAAHTTPNTRTFDLKGSAVIPGLIDGHAHMDREALRSVFPSLGKVRSIKDIQDRCLLYTSPSPRD